MRPLGEHLDVLVPVQRLMRLDPEPARGLTPGNALASQPKKLLPFRIRIRSHEDSGLMRPCVATHPIQAELPRDRRDVARFRQSREELSLLSRCVFALRGVDNPAFFIQR